jgi:hypothetical protein
MSTKPATGEALNELGILFGELCPEHRDVRPTWERPDLDAEVQALWRALGLSAATEWMAPRQDAATDEALLIEVFDAWLESPYLRDRWVLGPEDEPLPRRLLPPKRPRLLGGNGRFPRLILADEAEPNGKLFRLDGDKLEPLDLAYHWWCLHELLRQGSRGQSGAYRGMPPTTTLAVAGLDTPLLKAGDGVYLLQDSPLSDRTAITSTVPYRDLGCYVRFALALAHEDSERLYDPSALCIWFRANKNNKLLHPGQATAWPGLSRLSLTRPDSTPPRLRAVGQLDGCWVWVPLSAPPDGVLTLFADPADEQAVVASLVKRGGTITKKERLRKAISSLNW